MSQGKFMTEKCIHPCKLKIITFFLMSIDLSNLSYLEWHDATKIQVLRAKHISGERQGASGSVQMQLLIFPLFTCLQVQLLVPCLGIHMNIYTQLFDPTTCIFFE